MAQIGVDIGTYEFNASAGTITFIGVDIADIFQIKPIINGNRGLVIFNPLSDGKSFENPLWGELVGNVLILDHDTSGYSDNDSLYICVSGTEADAGIDSLNNKMNTLLGCVNELVISQEETNKYLRKIYNTE